MIINKVNTILCFAVPPERPLNKQDKVVLQDTVETLYKSYLRKLDIELNKALNDYNELLDIQGFSIASNNDHELKVTIKNTKRIINRYKLIKDEINGWIDEINEFIKKGIFDYKFVNNTRKYKEIVPYKPLNIEKIREKFQAYK